MDRNEVKAQFIKMIQPFVRNLSSDQINDNTLLIEDLNVNSARMVDIMLEMEECFEIRVEDEEASQLTSVGGAIDLIVAKKTQLVEKS